jgi:hypothetical protein
MVEINDLDEEKQLSTSQTSETRLVTKVIFLVFSIQTKEIFPQKYL